MRKNKRKNKTKRKNPRKARKASIPGGLAWALVLLFLLFTILVLLAVLRPERTQRLYTTDSPKDSPSKPQQIYSPESSEAHRSPASSKKKALKPEIALIIDDMGQRPRLERKFFALDLTLNFSFLPYAPFTQKLAREAHQKGFTVMVHLPMEAINGNDPGPGALKLSMTKEEIQNKVREMISRVPFASGANQHMGSLFSQDPLKMKWVLEVLQKKQMFFIDSRTTPHTVASLVAKTLKIPFAERGHFLDNNLKEDFLEKSFKDMLAKARNHGRLIVIAHPHPQTLKLLKRHRKDLIEQVNLVSVKKMVEVRP